MENEKIYLVRKRPADYYVNYKNGIKNIPYKWNGFVEGRKPHVQAVPREVFDELNMSGNCIRNGELVVADEQPNKEAVMDEILDVQEVLDNSHSHDEIVAILSGNINKMKTALNKVTVNSEKSFIKGVAEDIKDELSGAKTSWIEQWYKYELDEEK